MKENGKDFIKTGKKAGAAAALLIAAAVLVLVRPRNGGEAGDGESTEAILEPVPSETAEELLASHYVDAGEESLLSALYGELSRGELKGAAELINENEEELRTLVQETLGGEKYCYYEETDPMTGEELHRLKALSEENEERGMVVTRYNTVFFGSFFGGKPEGECLAIQAMVLNEPRYTYAEGTWSGGKMNGSGRTGYRYYENAPEGGFVMAEKSGTYRENLLDGDFVYWAEYESREKLHWELEADMGVTVLSGAWVYYANRGEYMLPSREDASRAYALKKEQAGAVLWNNLIQWDE